MRTSCGVSHPHSVFASSSSSLKFYRTRIGTTGTSLSSGKPPACCNLWRPTARPARPDASFPRMSSLASFLRLLSQAGARGPAAPLKPVPRAAVTGPSRLLSSVSRAIFAASKLLSALDLLDLPRAPSISCLRGPLSFLARNHTPAPVSTPRTPACPFSRSSSGFLSRLRRTRSTQATSFARLKHFLCASTHSCAPRHIFRAPGDSFSTRSRTDCFSACRRRFPAADTERRQSTL